MGTFQHIERENDLLSPMHIQPQLEIGKADDANEKEANQLADKVMRMPEKEEEKGKMTESKPLLQKMTESPVKPKMQESGIKIQKQTSSETAGIAAPGQVEQGISSSKGSGQSLAPDLQQEMGSKMNADLSGVKVHTDERAAQMNQEVGAKAFTHGNDIYFNSGQYNPASRQGKHLLAHELIHTVQQGNGINRKIQRITDEQFESGSGVGAAIRNGTMVEVPAIMGQVYSIKGVLGKPDMEVVFQFVKAYQGSYKYIATDSDVKGIYVKLTGDVTDKKANGIGDLDMLQVVTAYKVNENDKEKKKEVFEPDKEDDERKKRAGRNDDNAKSKGSAIDTNPNPYASPLFTAAGGGQTGYSFSSRPATIWDAPGTTQTNTIIKSVGKEFETYLMCNIGGKNVMLARIDWGYFIDENKVVSFSPTPTISLIASDRMKDSVERWDKLQDHRKTNTADVMTVVPDTADMVNDPSTSTTASEKISKDSKVIVKNKFETESINTVDKQQFQWWYVSILDGAKETGKEGFMKNTNLKNFNE